MVRVAAALSLVGALTASGPAWAAEPPHPCLRAPVVATVVDAFRPPACRWCPGNRGLEYVTRPGQAVQAGASGTVTFVGTVAGTSYVVVDHGWGSIGRVRATYGRLASVLVRSGQMVVAGQGLGRAGDRLYFGVREGPGRYTDPADYLLRRVRRARLVPVDGSTARPPRAGSPRRWTCTARERQRQQSRNRT